MFTHDVDGKPRNNKRLLPKRNWCAIAEYHPGSTPPPTPPSLSPTASEDSLPQEPQRPSMIQRTLSLGRGESRPAKLIRRLSLGGKDPTSPQANTPTSSRGAPVEDSPLTSPHEYNRRHPAPAPPQPTHYDSAPIPTRPINMFQRRPTNLSEKAAAKGGAIGEQVDLEYGLDISLNCEIKQGDPSGSTEQYRLLVPALFYDGPLPEHKPRKRSILKRLGSVRGNGSKHNREDWSENGSEHHSDAETVSHVSDEPQSGGRFRRLSGVFSRPTTLLQKQPSSQPAIKAAPPFVPRPRPQQTSPSVAAPAPFQPRPQVTTQAPRPSLTAAYQQRSFPGQPNSPSYTVKRSPAANAVTHVSSPLQRIPPATASAPPAPISHNQTAPLGYDSDDVSDEDDLDTVKRSGSRFSRSGAAKFFGEDLPANGVPPNNLPINGSGTGKQRRSSGGYGGIDAWQEKKKGWKRFF